MKYLLDTHMFLWTLGESHRLSERVSTLIKDPNNTILVSAVSLWEISIKHRIGKLNLDGLLLEELIGLSKQMELELIDLSPEEAVTYGRLSERDHKDPFDRMLVWQAIKRGYVLVSQDLELRRFTDFGLKLVW